MKEVFVFMDDYKQLNDKELKELIVSESKKIYNDTKARHLKKLKAEKIALFSGKQQQYSTDDIEPDSKILNKVNNNDKH